MDRINSEETQARLIKVTGVVQGVGFRPFVYRQAKELGLSGGVRNTSGNVRIEVEGAKDSLDVFLTRLKTAAPPMARIEKIKQRAVKVKGWTGFVIQDSQTASDEYQLVSPDIAACKDCIREIFDPGDRRYRYPFTNCTNCGPRFTIIEDIPYDRAATTMRSFNMCPVCQQEYHDPADRRFHAQPNACPVCGPWLELVDADGKRVVCRDAVAEAGRLLRQGKILALRGLGGFQLACDATCETVVGLLRQRKKRPAKPFAVMLADPAKIRDHCRLTAAEEKLLTSPAAPIVLTKWRRSRSAIVDSVAPGINELGVMLPYTPLHHLLVHDAGIPLIMTSGNLSEEPIARDNAEALRRLHGIADYFLLHNREIYARYDDSVFRLENRRPVVLRRARGYAPYPVFLPDGTKQVLACGAELKNTFCLTRGNHAFVSQHIGDMENAETAEHFEDTLGLYKSLFRIRPEIVACDMHPEYLPSKFASQYAANHKIPLVKIQHHHAHIVSCLAENGILDPVIGVSFDGTGYGSDGNIWGGEFLVTDRREYRRAGQLEYVPMPGGALAIKKPYRMALGYIYHLLGEKA